MIPVRPVVVRNGAFVFCRTSLALVLWAAFLFRLDVLVPVTTAILLVSALAGVDRAPMILLWTWTGERVRATREVVLDRGSMRFAHALGTLFGLVVTVLLYTAPASGRAALLAFCIVKTIAAAGFCSASKLYDCVSAGGCCGIVRQR